MAISGNQWQSEARGHQTRYLGQHELRRLAQHRLDGLTERVRGQLMRLVADQGTEQITREAPCETHHLGGLQILRSLLPAALGLPLLAVRDDGNHLDRLAQQ